MIEIQRITPEIAKLYKEVRLWALQDSPLAFGSTYARESLLTDEDWHNRSANLDEVEKIGFLAMDGEKPCGIVLCFRDDHDPSEGDVISMWVAPQYRRAGLGRRLLDTVRQWATSRKLRTLHLMVTNTNDSAIAFYERYGFKKTGRTEPYPNDPSLLEFEMTRPVDE